MSKELLAALVAAPEDDAADALSAALEGSYRSTPRDGVAAGLETLQRKVAARESAKQEQADAEAKTAAAVAETARIAAANAAAVQAQAAQ